MDPWQVTLDAFPRGGTPSERWHYLWNYAVLAPSGHNTQPWRFGVVGEKMALYADRQRSLAVVDPQDRALIISCGAALFNLRVALAAFGYGGTVTTFPDADQPDLLAWLEFGETCSPDERAQELCQAIVTRRTDRRPYQGSSPLTEGGSGAKTLTGEQLQALERVAQGEGVDLQWLDSPERRWLMVEWVGEGDRIQMANPQFRQELSHWIKPSTNKDHDGIPSYAQGIPPALDFVTPLVAQLIRWVDLGDSQAQKDQTLVANAPHLALLVTEADDPDAWLATGQALSAVLLEAELWGVRASFFNQPLEVQSLREQVTQQFCSSAFPQLLFRLGYPLGAPLPPTPRHSPPESGL
ncbi:hypothetical protein K4A83_03310 [Spirulina subsalsa FACHB-351]|uniref:Nitroreductase n=1 Tax=Spirulina subsalsa FACHB-351 TaxID=234711 RepID=A0ABT3L1E8_9CYAN|nr:hypothetical protein [Spirulina subsalsa]MCW6035303.1 hypothetical protein [Spirulina subsalsa FACHB-351]